jgi:sugar phosphate isomerase/epimerase
VTEAVLRLGAYERWWQGQYIIPGETLPERLRTLEELGYELIQLARGTFAGDHGHLEQAFAGSSIRIAVAGVGGPSLAASTPEERREAVECLRRSLELAARYGAIGAPLARSHTLPDLSPLWSANDLARALVVDGLRQVQPLCRDLGVCVLVEPLNRYESPFVQTLADAAAICEEVGGGTLKILADFYHMQLEESDIEAAVVAAGPHIGFVHVADSNRCEPGSGHADFGPLFRGLKRIGYQGYVSLECRVLAEDRRRMLAEVRDLLRDRWARS